MSQEDARLEENFEVVRRCLATFESDPEAWLETLDPAIEWYPEEERHDLIRGREGAKRARERWMETFKEGSHRYEIEELAGQGEHVFSGICEYAEGAGSEIEIESRIYHHRKIRKGKVAYIYETSDRAEALEAAGLSE